MVKVSECEAPSDGMMELGTGQSGNSQNRKARPGQAQSAFVVKPVDGVSRDMNRESIGWLGMKETVVLKSYSIHAEHVNYTFST